ncbi:XapX domain-containing protein [Saccharopolyspora indica]|uniref:DUF1427 family protein n=1 Tax=Saccharopolyspora indica TaxID=1229659 RepID=UPI0022EB66EF|nr:DUF1427 family protein [Saccharopolyspora indica]MDA3643092.1 DUF1427 family protein [Saccharopolyspora indica]
MNRLVLRYALSLGAGILAGILCWLMGVPTPAPPWIALVGLLGIVIGETAGRLLLTRLRRRPATPSDTPAPDSDD